MYNVHSLHRVQNTEELSDYIVYTEYRVQRYSVCTCTQITQSAKYRVKRYLEYWIQVLHTVYSQQLTQLIESKQ